MKIFNFLAVLLIAAFATGCTHYTTKEVDVKVVTGNFAVKRYFGVWDNIANQSSIPAIGS
ncbi:MAG: hypothetical protein RL208_43 [Pseudomonadota bacterium]|jgi:hypothetical protein